MTRTKFIQWLHEELEPIFQDSMGEYGLGNDSLQLFIESLLERIEELDDKKMAH